MEGGMLASAVVVKGAHHCNTPQTKTGSLLGNMANGKNKNNVPIWVKNKNNNKPAKSEQESISAQPMVVVDIGLSRSSGVS